MAAELITTIHILSSLTVCKYFRCRLTDLGTLPIIKAFGYQILDKNENALTEETRFDPPDTGEFKIYVNDIAEEILFTETPLTDSSGWVAQSGYTNNLKLRYWEYETDEDCNTVKNSIQIGGNIPIINASLQLYENPGAITFFHFQKKPEYIELCKNGYDFITLKSDTQGTVFLRYYNNKTLISTSQYPYQGDAGGIIVNLLRIPLNIENATKVEVEANGGLLYTIAIRDCDDSVNLVFRDPYGSWSGLCLTRKKEGLQTSQTLASKAEICKDVTEKQNFQKLGLTITQKESHDLIEAEYNFKFTDLEYIKRFIASRDYLIEVEKYNGSKVFAKFILKGGNYTVYEEGEINLSISGYVSAKFNNNPTNVI